MMCLIPNPFKNTIPNLRKSSGTGGKKRKNVAKCFGLFQRKVHKKASPEGGGRFGMTRVRVIILPFG